VGLLLQTMLNLHELPSTVQVVDPTAPVSQSANGTVENGPELVHFAKWRRVADALTKVRRYQKVPYLIEVNTDIQKLLVSASKFPTEDEQSEQSKRLELAGPTTHERKFNKLGGRLGMIWGEM
jgi:hypothetical protein